MMKPKTTLSIDGQFLYNFEKVILKQSINEHHTFTITLDYDSIEKVGAYTLDSSREWLGKITVINFNDTEFLGVITNIKLQHDNGFDGKLLVSGYSKTILLENGTHMYSWLGKNLKDIISDTVNASGIEAKINPVFSTLIEYEAQYKESHFEFIQRMAKQYNEWLYYDGLQLVFGKPTLEDSIIVEYGADMDTINIDITAITSGANKYSYSAQDNTRIETQTRGEVAGLNELGDYAFEMGKELFPIKTNGYSLTRVKDRSEIDIVVKNKQASKVAKANVLSGTSTKQGLTIGSIIKVTAAQRSMGVFDIKNYGEYIITKIKHEATGLSEYTNEFEAIASSLTILPEPVVTLPQAHSQIATIIDNLDPRGLGRVKAQLLWQKYEQTTTWLRVMTPDAGKSNEHGEIRGNLVIPEVGDQVMVGFRYGDPNRAYVMGSLYNGGNISAGKENRNSVVSRMGSKMVMDDNDGSLQLTDKGGANMRFDGIGNATINAKETNTVNVGATKNEPAQSIITADKDGNIVLDAKTSITLKVGENFISIDKEGLIQINGEDLNQTAKNKFDIKGKKVSQSAEGANFKINSDKKVIVSGGDEVQLK